VKSGSGFENNKKEKLLIKRSHSQNFNRKRYNENATS